MILYANIRLTTLAIRINNQIMRATRDTILRRHRELSVILINNQRGGLGITPIRTHNCVIHNVHRQITILIR